MAQNRRAAAIMFAGIAGYTAVMQQDEAAAMRLRNKLTGKPDEKLSLYESSMF